MVAFPFVFAFSFIKMKMICRLLHVLLICKEQMGVFYRSKNLSQKKKYKIVPLILFLLQAVRKFKASR